jgi:hypothetical protein
MVLSVAAAAALLFMTALPSQAKAQVVVGSYSYPTYSAYYAIGPYYYTTPSYYYPTPAYGYSYYTVPTYSYSYYTAPSYGVYYGPTVYYRPYGVRRWRWWR